MVSYILTRTFVISAMLVGAAPLANAAPIRLPLTEAALRLPLLQHDLSASTLVDIVAHVALAQPHSSAYLVLPISLNSEREINRALRSVGLSSRDASPEPKPFDLPVMRRDETASLDTRQCMHDGSCMRRREPEAHPEPIVEERQCMHDGSCMKREPAPEPVAETIELEARQCMHDGSCMKREPQPQPDPVVEPVELDARQCLTDGSCMKRREAAPEPQPIAEPAAPEARQCLTDGSCM
ncbi:hypothetical protein CERSUDRAFT_118226 [Gelatoporia subvermispora B]|uniref:Uncharacterized protein n=1 Tax=Ceriporiopsis subvermispora (strain B) TaxID=914234 RepID=M2PBZ9_CERS8|nr:hypothetical protein CERSUDRAFT_118226 [Gelatoporia subvermispora B]